MPPPFVVVFQARLEAESVGGHCCGGLRASHLAILAHYIDYFELKLLPPGIWSI
jgi:hypothetical protein